MTAQEDITFARQRENLERVTMYTAKQKRHRLGLRRVHVPLTE
jgi:hypothetical protein